MDHTKTQSPVAVIGNGPVGQTTALLLARWGVPVLLLDDRPERDLVGSKAICQQRDVLDIWASVGVGQQIATEGVSWCTARTFYHDQEVFSYTMPEVGSSPFPAFVNISQSRTEKLLDDQIAKQPLIDTRWSHHVTGLTQDSSGVQLECQTPSGVTHLNASHAVVCAGSRGRDLRKTLGVTFEGRSFDDHFLICDIETDMPGWSNERRFYFDPAWNPGRQVLVHPCPDSTFRIDWQVPSDYDLEAEERSGALDERIRKIIGDKPYRIVWNSVYRFHARLTDRFRVGRVLLAGDCAHIVAPFGARGLNSGAADAENAAWKIAFVRHGWADEELLESYHDERRAAAIENLEITNATMDFLVPQDEAGWKKRRSILEHAAHDESARAEVNSGRLCEPFWYTESALTTPNPMHPFAGRPARGQAPSAGPGILLPDIPVSVKGQAPRRLHEYARDGWLFLVAPGADMAAVHAAAAGCGAPAKVLAIDAIDIRGSLAQALASRTGEVWLVRPDAYVAAVLDRPGAAALDAALQSARGRNRTQVGAATV
jgi:pentachlorophenol monooxygenase/3-(3-hydroxy-phenyl)propionate hydroxylase